MKRRVVPASARALLALLFVLGIGAVFSADGTFFVLQTHRDLLAAMAIPGMVAIGMTFVIVSGGIDLSVGSTLALCNMVFAALLFASGWPWPIAVLATALLATLLGAGNGALCAWLRLQPFVATLATMAALRGLAKAVPALLGQQVGTKIMPPPDQMLTNPLLEGLAGDVLPHVPALGLLFCAAALVTHCILRKTILGRWIFAVGGNELASHLAGIPVARVKLFAYSLCGLLAGIGGVCQTARSRLGNPEAGQMLELSAIAAVVIGGTSLQGGRGGIGLTVLGVLTIGYIEKILSINNVADHWRLVIQGAIIVLAVLLQERKP